MGTEKRHVQCEKVAVIYLETDFSSWFKFSIKKVQKILL